MARMTDFPSPGLNAAVLDVLRSARTESGAPLSDVWGSLITFLTEDEADLLPLSVANVLPLLARDRDRLLLVADLAVALDLYEAAETLMQIGVVTRDPTLVLAASSLARDPGAREGLKED